MTASLITDRIGGISFLVEGAPGSGKSALLEECRKLSEVLGWHTVTITPDSLWNPQEMTACLRKADVSLPAGTESNMKSSRDVLYEARPGLVLVLEEIHRLSGLKEKDVDRWREVFYLLSHLHNSTKGRTPALLCSGDLLTYVMLDEEYGLHRFECHSHPIIGALSWKDEMAVIEDWLQKDGWSMGFTSEWVRTLGERIQGWPAYIPLYMEPAIEVLQESRGRMTDEGLETVLAKGDKRKDAYLQEKLSVFTEQERISLALMFSGGQVPDTSTFEESKFRSCFPPDMNEETFDIFWQKVEEKGVLPRTFRKQEVGWKGVGEFLVKTYVGEPTEPEQAAEE